MARSRPYEHRFRSAREAAEYLKATLEDGDKAHLIAVENLVRAAVNKRDEQWCRAIAEQNREAEMDPRGTAEELTDLKERIASFK